MCQYFIKKRSIHSFIDWVTYAHDRAELHYNETTEILNDVTISIIDRNSLLNEKERARKYLDEYNEFISELNDVELLVLKHIIKYDNKIKGMDHERYGKIKMNIYSRWCRKFMPSDLVFVHELDKDTFCKILKSGREEAGFSRKSVADFLLISESSLKMYELGERIPKINVLYALCELYGIDCQNLIKSSLK